MQTKVPSQMTFHEFHRLHRALLPGESPPRLPSLLEQLLQLRGSSLRATPAADEHSVEPQEGHDEEE